MKISERGLAMIRYYESFSPVVYLCPAGLKTIGYGHVLTEEEKKRENWRINLADGARMLAEDCRIAENAINAVTDQLKQHQFDALVSLVYNIGAGNFKTSTIKKLLKAGDIDGIAAQFDRWIFVKGKKSKGLMNRRAAEKKLFG
jgi:lysozyme